MLDILTAFISILIEATPFLVLGTLIAVLVQRVSLFDTLLKRLPKNTYARRICFSLLGVVLPVCECGNIPLARSLMRKGLTIGESTTFLMAAPILNPVTFITTYEAFRNIPWMTPARMLSGFAIALIVGEIVGRLGSKALTKEFEATCKNYHLHGGGKDYFSIAFAKEFFVMFKLLIIGAFIAAVAQYFLNQQTLAGLNDNLFLGVIIMIGLGFIISICSNVDAFFALGFAGTFRYGALLAFMVAGPLIDIKIVTMLKNTYSKRALISIVGIVILLSIGIGLGVSYVE